MKEPTMNDKSFSELVNIPWWYDAEEQGLVAHTANRKFVLERCVLDVCPEDNCILTMWDRERDEIILCTHGTLEQLCEAAIKLANTSYPVNDITGAAG